MEVPRQAPSSISPLALPSARRATYTFAIGTRVFGRLTSAQASSRPLPAPAFGGSPVTVGPRSARCWEVQDVSQWTTPETSTLPTRIINAFVKCPPPPESLRPSPATVPKSTAARAAEDLLALVVPNAGALITDAQPHRGPGLKLDGDLRAGRAGSHCVVEQYPQDPGHTSGISQSPHRSAGVLQLRVDPPLRRPQLEFGQHSAAQLTQFHGLGAQRHLGIEP